MALGEIMMKINSAKFVTSAVRRSQYPNDKKCEFLLVGRSNVGKSSFINKIVNRKNIARTSALPGKTQTLNFYLINDLFYLVDVPGYGFAKVSKKLKNRGCRILQHPHFLLFFICKLEEFFYGYAKYLSNIHSKFK